MILFSLYLATIDADENSCVDFATSEEEAVAQGSGGCLVQFSGWDQTEYCGLYDPTTCSNAHWGPSYSACCPFFCNVCEVETAPDPGWLGVGRVCRDSAGDHRDGLCYENPELCPRMPASMLLPTVEKCKAECEMIPNCNAIEYDYAEYIHGENNCEFHYDVDREASNAEGPCTQTECCYVRTTYPPTYFPSVRPSRLPSSNPTETPTTNFPSLNPSTFPTEVPTDSPISFQYLAGMCADSSGNALEGWFLEMNSFSQCDEECARNSKCTTISFGRSIDTFNNSGSHCVMHMPDISTFQPPLLYKGEQWKILNGSNRFDNEDSTYTTNTYRQTMMCKKVTGIAYQENDQILTTMDDWATMLIFLGCVIFSYHSIIWMCSGSTAEKKDTVSDEVGGGAPDEQLEITRSSSSFRAQDGYCAKIFDETCTQSLFPNVEENRIGKKGMRLFCAWFMDLNVLQKLGFSWNLLDIFTDALFAYRMIETHLRMSYIAAVSILFSTFAFATMVLLDIIIFAAQPEDAQQSRRLLRIRWGVLMFVPLEDFVMISLAIYIFHKDDGDYAAFLSIVVSFMSIIFLHCIKVILEEKGTFEAMSSIRSSPIEVELVAIDTERTSDTAELKLPSLLYREQDELPRVDF